jgi:E3 SUMO-protein ligase RanBP2
MATSRIDQLIAMREKNPRDGRVLFALALEYEKLERWEDTAAVLNEYLELADDEGNAWGRLGTALHRLGRTDEAKAALERGIEAANRHGHPTMAAEFAEMIDDLT